jgi:hypothetical protein
MPGTSPYLLDRRVTTEPGDSASFPFDRVEENRVFEERAVTANMSVQGVKLNDWATRIVSLEGGGGSGPSGDAVVFNTLADVALNSIAADVDFIVVGGYADAGDCPPLPLKRVVSEPVHAGKKQSADGAWWEYVAHGPVYIEWFGGKADYHITPQDASALSSINPSPTDNLQPLTDAWEFLYAYIGYFYSPGSVNNAAGPTIQLSYGSYYCSNTIRPDRNIVLQGMGHGIYHDNANTRIYFPAGVKGVEINFPAATTPVTYGGASIIRNIFFSSAGHGGQTTKHGIELNAASAVEGCTIHNFGGNGINIAADIGNNDNANTFYLNLCNIYGNAGHGVYCVGGDANAGTGIAINVASNGGWGIRDESFLGNTWISCHEAYNVGGPYYMAGGNNRSSVIGCYNEGFSTPSYCGPNAHFIGGTHASGITVSTDGGNVWVTNSLYPVTLASAESGEDLSVRLRGPGANRIMTVTTPEGTHAWGYNDSAKYIDFFGFSITDHLTNLAFGRPESVYNNKSFFTRGFWLGGDFPGDFEGSARYFGSMHTPTWGGFRPGSYAVGDTLVNALLGGGQHWAWVCVTAGAIGSAWGAGQNYGYEQDERSAVVANGGNYYRLVAETLGDTLSVDAPVHGSGTVTGATDGHSWKYLTGTTAVFKRFGPTMGALTTTASDPILDLSQTWNAGGVTFTGHKTNITSTASAADSMLEDWQVSSSTQANIRKDGRIAATASTSPVAGGAQTIQMTSTAGLGVYAGANAPTVSAAKGSLYLRTNGSTTNDRMYVNTDGGTTWTAVTTAA